jgi:hypothetical protein
MSATFQVTLAASGPTGIEVPPEIVESFDAGKRVPVVVTIGNYSYRSTVAPYKGPYMISVSAENRAGAGVGHGDTITVTLEHDTAPRTVEVPNDLLSALDKATSAAWATLSFSHQNAHVQSILDAKTDETRARRIAAVVAKLALEN